MKPEDLQKRSSEKVQEVLDLMKKLNLKVEARQRVDKSGFIQNAIFWIDDENYHVDEIENKVDLNNK